MTLLLSNDEETSMITTRRYAELPGQITTPTSHLTPTSA
jgi:hypothetical protein